MICGVSCWQKIRWQLRIQVFVEIRTKLATVLGIRMCPSCPHCSQSQWPCQDALGSVAEAMGGVLGRADAMFGAVECQKTTGALHYHFFVCVQRVRQYGTLKEIAEKLKARPAPSSLHSTLVYEQLLLL